MKTALLALSFLLATSPCPAEEPRAQAPPPSPEAGAERPPGGTEVHGPAPGAPAQDDHPDHATVTHRFDDPARWERVFDDPARGEWQRPAEVVAALGISAGDRVADLGAGTGYFEAFLSRAVGPRGAVFAVEVEPSLVGHLRERAEREKTANVIPVLGSLDNPRLPAGAVDLVLIVDTYHHIDGRVSYFRALRETLTQRGRVAIVDFEKRPLPVGPPPEHKLAPGEVAGEMRAAGYVLDRDLDPLLPYQYLLVFRPAGAPAAP